MKRSVSETTIGDRLVRYRTKLEDDPSLKGSFEARSRLLNLFQTILNVPDLINCGFSAPHDIKIYHSGESWVLEAEATTEVGV